MPKRLRVDQGLQLGTLNSELPAGFDVACFAKSREPFKTSPLPLHAHF